MPKVMQDLIEQYIEAVKKIYGSHVRQIILYGSYARGDFRSDLDVDIMILLDLSDLELKAYGQQLSYMTYDFNMDHDLDIKPIAKSEAHFNKWIVNYPFYANIHREGVVLYGAASAVENAVCEIVDPENIMLLIVIKLKSAHSELLERIKQL